MITQPLPNPTSDLNKDNYSFGTGKLKFFDIVPPVEEIVIDNDQVKKSFDELPIIPYSGNDKTTSHKLVSVLYNFKQLSSTYAGILNDLKSYSLGRKIEIQKIEDSIFDIADEQEISNDEKRKFSDFIKDNFIFHRSDILSLTYWMNDCDDSTGQVGVEIIKKTILGKTTITYKYHKPMNYAFLRGDIIGEEIVISEKWDYDYLKKHPPLVVPLYPYWEKYKDGYERTFYFKAQGGDLYGRPDDLSCLPDKYNEYKLKQYLTKKNKKLWMPDVFIETSDSKGGFNNDQEARDKGFKNSKQRLEQNFTNAGDNASSFVITNKDSDSDQTFIHEFQGLKNSKEVMNFRQMFKESICEANGWTTSLLEMKGATGLSNNIFMDLFSIKDVTKISEVQLTCEGFINDLLQIGFKALNYETDRGIKFVSPLKALIDDYRNSNSKGNNIEQPGREGDVSKTGASM